jgi:peptidoglycan-associated lipoprotein
MGSKQICHSYKQKKDYSQGFFVARRNSRSHGDCLNHPNSIDVSEIVGYSQANFNLDNKEVTMLRRCLLLSGVLLCVSMFLLTVSCAPKKSVVTQERPTGLPTETVGGESTEEEQIEEPEVIMEEELQALRQLEKEALREGALADIYFDFNRYNLRPEAQKKLEKTADWLIKSPGARILIEGHCDERGTQEYNLALGQRRAASVQKYLHSLGVDSARIDTVSYGEERPADPRHNEEAWAKNRRAHFTVIKK